MEKRTVRERKKLSQLRRKRRNARLRRIGFRISQIVLVAITVVCLAGILAYYTNLHRQNELNEILRVEAAETGRKATETGAGETTASAETEASPREYTPTVDFEMLQEANPDAYAWISVAGTEVDYPVLQSDAETEEDYYLSHNLDGSDGYPGCIYTQKLNNKDFSDPVTILYGHNMKNGTMFASLHSYEDKDFFDENPYVYVYTPGQELIYLVYAAYHYSDILIPYHYHDFADTADFDSYLDEIALFGAKEGGNLRNGVILDFDSHILTLSTCNATYSERYLVQCVLIDYLGEGVLGEEDLAECEADLLAGWREIEPK